MQNKYKYIHNVIIKWVKNGGEAKSPGGTKSLRQPYYSDFTAKEGDGVGFSGEGDQEFPTTPVFNNSGKGLNSISD